MVLINEIIDELIKYSTPDVNKGVANVSNLITYLECTSMSYPRFPFS